MRHRYGIAVSAVVLLMLILLALAHTAFANPYEFAWHDDIESGWSGWGSSDFTAGAAPHFHWDSYLAFDGYSWWCGNFDYDADGGYGNSWDDRLDLPPISIGSVPVEEISWGALKSRYRDAASTGHGGASRDAVIPMLTFAYRCDAEAACDYTYVDAKVGGEYVHLNDRYDGRVPWTDLGDYGFDLSGSDDPLEVRFRFISDGAFSDEDGLYLSVGGAFAVDNVKVYDFATGEILFYDSVGPGTPGQCIPSVPPASGDFWHVIDRECPAYSDPHSWWCGDDSDTSRVPPGLQNGLFSPVVDCGGVISLTAYAAMHLALPHPGSGFVTVYGRVGPTYYPVTSLWGDFGSCDGWSSEGMYAGFDIGQFGTPPFSEAGVLFVMYTGLGGSGPASAGDAGVMIDDLWICGNGALPEWRGRDAHNVYDAESYAASPKSSGLFRHLTRP